MLVFKLNSNKAVDFQIRFCSRCAVELDENFCSKLGLGLVLVYQFKIF